MKRSTNGRVGWVRRNAGLITESAHASEKSAPSYTDASIHCLHPWPEAVVGTTSGTRLVSNDQRTNLDAQLSHSALGFFRVAIG
jgi:hypothetical protein